jgi:hypothetical protein
MWYSNVFAKKKDKPQEKLLAVDFDGTIARDRYPEIGDPEPGVRKAFKKLREAGYKIMIFTCRLTKSPDRPAREIDKQEKMIEEWMEKHDIPYDGIERGHNGKPHFFRIIDNKAMHYTAKHDWEVLCKRLIGMKDD